MEDASCFEKRVVDWDGFGEVKVGKAGVWGTPLSAEYNQIVALRKASQYPDQVDQQD
jgi:hypothetical protein